MDDSFEGGFNTDIWTKEVAVGGFGYSSSQLLSNCCDADAA